MSSTRSSGVVASAALLIVALSACRGPEELDDDARPVDAPTNPPIDAPVDAARLLSPLRFEQCGLVIAGLDHPATEVGRRSVRSLTLLNDSAVSVDVMMRIEPAGAPFYLDSQYIGILRGQGVSVDVRFAPTSVGPKTAELVVEQQAFNSASMGPQRITLTGTALAEPTGPTTTQTNLDFSRLPNEAQQLELRNRAAAPIRLFPPQVSDHFRLLTWACPDELPSGASCSLGVGYRPSAGGCQVGSFAIPTSGGDVLVALAGPALAGQVAVQIDPSNAVGTITSNPSGLSCTASSCSGTFQPGTQVSLTANTSVFGGWNDPACGLSPVCTVPAVAGQDMGLHADMVVGTANTIAVTIEGEGEVSSFATTPFGEIGVTCRSSCVMPVAAGSRVMLVATGNDVFDGWSGECSGDEWCQLVVDRDRVVTATFAPAPGLTAWTPPTRADSSALLPTGEVLMVAGQRMFRMTTSGVVSWARDVLLPGRTAVGIETSSDGGIFVLTTTFSSHILYRFDVDGDEVWSRRWTLAPCQSGSWPRDTLVIAAGQVAFVAGQQLMVVDAADGTDAWSAVVPGCHAIAAGPGGMIGVSRRGATLETHAVRRYAADGQVLGVDLPIPGFGLPAIAFDAVAGLITHNSYGGIATVARQAGDGSAVFTHEELAGSGMAARVAVAPDGSIVATRSDPWNQQVTGDAVMHRYAPDGTLVGDVTWPATPLGSSPNRIVIEGIATDATGGLLLSGSSTRPVRGRTSDLGWMASLTLP